MKKLLIILLSCGICVSTFAETLVVVDETACQRRGNTIRICEQREVTTMTHEFPSYIPVETLVNVNKNAYCSTAYPIYLDIVGDDNALESFNLFQISHVAISQANYEGVSVSVNAPYAHVASFDYRCGISATILPNIVNIGQLTRNLRDLKINTADELSLVESLIEKQTLIIDLSAAVSIYAQVLDVAEGDIASFYVLNTILQEACLAGDPDEPCSWSNQIQIILDNSLDLEFRHQFLLFSLAQELDGMVPTDCDAGNCVADLIDAETETVINSIMGRVPTKDAAEAELTSYISQKNAIELDLFDYQSTAQDYNIDWETL